jgi:hypothetical protein
MENNNDKKSNNESSNTAEEIAKNIKDRMADSTDESQGEEPIMTRIVLLDEAFESVKVAIDEECRNNQRAISLSALLCVLIVLIGGFYAQYLYRHGLPSGLDWMQFSYTVVVRITVTVAFLSLASFCFKLLRSYLHIYHNNKHRKIIVKSMASLLEASDPRGRELIFKRLLDIIIKYSNTGLLTKENDFKNGDLTEMLRKVIDKLPSDK